MSHAWSTVTLRDVLHLTIDAVNVDPAISYPIAGVYSFARGLFARVPISGTETTYKTLHCLHRNDFVLSQLKGWEGAIARIPDEFDGWFLSPQFPTFRAEPDSLDVAYLEWYCKQAKVWEELKNRSRGMGARRDSVSPTQFLSLAIPLPPLEEQRRIVARIEELAAKIEEARGLRREVVEEAKGLVSAEITQTLSKIKYQTKKATLASVACSITDGNHQAPPKADNGIPFIFINHIASGKLNFSGCNYVPEDYYQSLSPIRVPQRGDLLYTAVGSYGIPCLVDTDDAFCFQRHIAIIKPNSEVISSAYLKWILSSKDVYEQATKFATGSAQLTVPLSGIRQLTFPLPSMELQNQLAAHFEEMDCQVDALKRRQAETSAELDALLPSILDKAFKGEL
jgi:type I restriction enzyme S subunit